MKRVVRSPKGKPHKRQVPLRGIKALPGITLVLLCLAIPYRDAFYFNNGTGGEGWEIGKPAVRVWTANQPRPLPELQTFALELINRDRQLNGLSPLVEDSLLAQAAQAHAEDMMQRDYYDHVTPEGKTPTDRFAEIGGQGGVGENIAWRSGSFEHISLLNLGLVETLQKGWMYSNGHRANLLSPQYTRVGYGIARHPVSGAIVIAQLSSQSVCGEVRARQIASKADIP